MPRYTAGKDFQEAATSPQMRIQQHRCPPADDSDSQRLYFGLDSQMTERHSCYWTTTITSMPQQDFALLPSEKINILLCQYAFKLHCTPERWYLEDSWFLSLWRYMGLPTYAALSKKKRLARLTQYQLITTPAGQRWMDCRTNSYLTVSIN